MNHKELYATAGIQLLFFLFIRKLFCNTAAAVSVAVFTVGTADALSSVFL